MKMKMKNENDNRSHLVSLGFSVGLGGLCVNFLCVFCEFSVDCVWINCVGLSGSAFGLVGLLVGFCGLWIVSLGFCGCQEFSVWIQWVSVRICGNWLVLVCDFSVRFLCICCG